MSSYFTNTHKKGFTLVETLVAIAILMVALTAAFSVAQFGLSSTGAVKDRISAFFLAQEALEAVRNIKDGNLLEQSTNDSLYWLADIVPSNLCVSGNDYHTDYNLGDNSVPFLTDGCQSGTCPALRVENGLLKHSGGDQSRFTRTITVHEICSGLDPNQREARIQIKISWPGHPNGFLVSENITNWFSPL